MPKVTLMINARQAGKWRFFSVRPFLETVAWNPL